MLICPALNGKSQSEALSQPSGALILIGSMLHEQGYNVKIIHMVADGVTLSGLKKIVLNFKPDVVGITVNTFQTKSTKQISQVIKSLDNRILIVIGGPHPSALGTKALDDFPYVYVVVAGEGEKTMIDIVEGKSFEEIRGICYRSDNEYIVNKPRPLSHDLDYIPLPNLDLVNLSRFYGIRPVGAYPSMYIMASRGCPFRCTFCNKSVWGSTLRVRKPNLVIEEIRWLHQKYGVNEIYFQDDTFNINRKWAVEIFQRIIDEGLNKQIVYKAAFRVDERLLDEELLKLTKEAGFWMIFYGVESGNQGVLNGMKKGVTIREIKRAFELTHKVGLKTNASFIIGMPGESKETVVDTLNLYKEIKPDYFSFIFAIPFPNTELERILREKGHILETNYDKYSYGKCLIRTDELTRQNLIQLHDNIVREVVRTKIKAMQLREIIVKGVRHPKLALKIGFDILRRR